MVVEFSTALLEELKLTPNEFYVITLVKHKEFTLLHKFLKDNYTEEESKQLFLKLYNMKYFTSTSVLSNSYDMQQVKIGALLNSKLKQDGMFDEFLAAYPSSVIRTDGTIDYLRTDQKGCKQMYQIHTNLSVAKHKHILKCLEFEVEKRKREGSMKFMTRMSKWLSTEAWKSYEDEVNNSATIAQNAYGTELE